MPQLLKTIQGQIHTNINGDVRLVKSVSSLIQQEDYINLKGFIAFLQNLSKTDVTSSIDKPLNFGLVNKYNIETITLDISY
jgi:hypothetical protein